MNMQTTKWPAYTPAQARAMEDALIAVYKKEARENAGKTPNDYGGKYQGHGRAGGKKSTPARVFVSEQLQDKVLNLARRWGIITTSMVHDSLGVNESTSRRVLRRMLDNEKLVHIGYEPCGTKIYQAKVE